ncbi:MAG: hypothetical protein H0W08_19125 [Acidobacteria bacterium]|nr:hypothetical protein [Acidobacteriota bacterium]
MKMRGVVAKRRVIDYGVKCSFETLLERCSYEPHAAWRGHAAATPASGLFTTRLELIGELDKHHEGESPRSVAESRPVFGDPVTEADVRLTIGEILHKEVAAMNLDNFVVRPHRRVIEKYAKPSAWVALTPEALTELATEVSGLPAELDPEAEEAKRFDLLLLNLQLAQLRSEPAFARLRDQVKAIARLLEEKSTIPMVRQQMVLIQDLQTDEWWQDVTVPMLEVVRRRLRDLVKLIEKQQRKPIYTDFEDEMGPETGFALRGLGEGAGFAKFRDKAQAFLRAHQDHVTIQNLRTNKALTASDLSELERMLAESGVGAVEDIERAKSESRGLGLFVRSMVGMDREAAKQALAGFLAGKTLGANQIVAA